MKHSLHRFGSVTRKQLLFPFPSGLRQPMHQPAACQNINLTSPQAANQQRLYSSTQKPPSATQQSSDPHHNELHMPVEHSNQLKEEKSTAASVPSYKTPRQSRIKKTLKFSTDHELRENYLSFHGSIRIGKLLEDLDGIAGMCAYKHAEGVSLTDVSLVHDTDTSQFNSTIVTAGIDRISLLQNIVPYWDLTFEANVIWTGTSSMLVRIDVRQPKPQGGTPETVMVALFSMVAREKYTDSATKVTQLKPETEREKELYKFGEEHALLRKERRKERFEVVPPNDEERDILHRMWLQDQAKPRKIGAIQKTTDGHSNEPESEAIYRLQSTRIMMPQRRNIHNKIFGGYLLREAYELAWAVVYCATGSAPGWISLDENQFVQPVEIGSLVSFSAEIVYAEKRSCVIRVDADVMYAHTSQVDRTNVFHFIFQSSVPRQVHPTTYDEAIRFLEGRRIHQKGKEIQARMRIKGNDMTS